MANNAAFHLKNTATAAVGFVTAAAPATINLGSVGTADWMTFAGNATNPPRALAISSSGVHSKRLGGWILRSFDWCMGAAATVAIGGSGGIAMTSSATDDTCPAMSALTSNIPNVNVTAHPAVNYGYRFSVPADSFSRTLVLNMAVNGVKARITCHMSDGSLADQTVDVDAVTDNTFVQKQVTITYNAATNGNLMEVDVNTVTDYGTSTHLSAVYFAAVTVA